MSVGRLISILTIGITTFVFSSIFGMASGSPPINRKTTAPRLFLKAKHSVQTGSNPQIEKRNRAIELYRAGQFTEAVKVLRSVVKEDKTDHQAWYYLGLSLLSQSGKTKDAAKAFETTIRLQPRFALAHTGFAYVAMQRRKPSEAVLAARAALNIDPSMAEPHYIIGVVHITANDPAEALTEANQAVRLNPDFAPAHLLKSQALVGVYAKRGKDTRRTYQSPPPPPTLEERAERRRNRLAGSALLKQAADSLRSYLKLNPNAPSEELLREQLDNLEFYGVDPDEKTRGSDAPVPADEVTTKARVLMKPEPTYTESARKAQVVGTVVLRAVLAADGTVRRILVLASLPNGLTEASVRAARMIKFTPAAINGRPVSQFVQLEYNFNLY